MSDWSGTPKDLLELIFERLENDIRDCLRFSAVCTQWRLMSIEKGRHVVPPIVVMVHDDEDMPLNNGNIISFLSPNIPYKNNLPDVEGKRCCGSIKGMLITVDRSSGGIYLLNPILGSQISVPSPSVLMVEQQETGPISKVIISLNSNKDYVIVLFRRASKKVYLCKMGDEKWTSFEIRFGGINDITYHGDKLYVFIGPDAIEVFDLQKPDVKKYIKIMQPDCSNRLCDVLLKYFTDVKQLHIPREYGQEGRFQRYMVYLVDTPDAELFMVIRYRGYLPSDKYYNTVGFKVLRLVEDVGDWDEVESLGDRVLFLGMNSLCLMACDVPELRANSIYITDSRDSNGWLFNMEDRSIKPLYENHPFKRSSATSFTPDLRLRGL